VEIATGRCINGQGAAVKLSVLRGYPAAIRTDQGPEFNDRSLDQWGATNDVRLVLIQPGKPPQNACIESSSGKVA
jgi:putative transposase